MFNTFLETSAGAEETVDAGANWLTNFLNSLGSWLVTDAMPVAIRVIIGLVIMFISFKIINRISRRIEKKGDKDKYDKTLMRTIAYVVRLAAKVIITICIVGFVGFDVSGLTALIASLGVCFGLAVNGAVANIAGGVLILVTRPFKIDDFIEAQGVSGTVEDIHMVNTKLRTPDNKVIYVPNGALANGNIVNYSVKDIRRIDFTFSIGYAADYERAKAILTELLTKHELTLKDEGLEPFVRMSAHSASSIDIAARAWVKSGDYWTVNFDILEAVKAEFDKNGIEIPFNQLDVHVKND